MPLVALGIAAGVAGGAAQAYGAHKSAQASDTAAAASAKANADAIAEQQRQDAIQKQEFDQQQAAAKAQWDAQQQIRAPYRQAGSAALSSLGGILGVDFGSGGGGAPSGAPPAASASSPTPSGSDPVTQAILDNYKALGVAPTGPGSGPTDIAYMVQQAKASLASGERPLSYWLGPQGRIAQELAKAKGGSSTTPISAVMPRSLAPPMLQAGATMNALAPSYGQVVPISSLMGGA